MSTTISGVLSAGLSCLLRGTTDVAEKVNRQFTDSGAFAVPSDATVIWSGVVDLTAGAAVDLDLTALASPGRSTQTLATLYGLYLRQLTGTTPVKLGNAAANGWYAPYSAATVTDSITPDLPLAKAVATGWPVDATHKVLHLDPQGQSATVLAIVVGK